jgi:hypothetical protein
MLNFPVPPPTLEVIVMTTASAAHLPLLLSLTLRPRDGHLRSLSLTMRRITLPSSKVCFRNLVLSPPKTILIAIVTTLVAKFAQKDGSDPERVWQVLRPYPDGPTATMLQNAWNCFDLVNNPLVKAESQFLDVLTNLLSIGLLSDPEMTPKEVAQEVKRRYRVFTNGPNTASNILELRLKAHCVMSEPVSKEDTEIASRSTVRAHLRWFTRRISGIVSVLHLHLTDSDFDFASDCRGAQQLSTPYSRRGHQRPSRSRLQ